MKKIFVLIIAVLAIGFIGCDNGSSGGGDDDPPVTPKNPIITLRIINNTGVDIYVKFWYDNGWTLPTDKINDGESEIFEKEIEIDSNLYINFDYLNQNPLSWEIHCYNYNDDTEAGKLVTGIQFDKDKIVVIKWTDKTGDGIFNNTPDDWEVSVEYINK